MTKAVFDTCELQQSGVIRRLTGANGTERDVPTYLVDIDLGNGLLVTGVDATLRLPRDGEPESLQFPGAADILLGMNVINRGDFIVTNRNGGTQFYFRVPSAPGIDGFINQAENDAIMKAGGQNTPSLENRAKLRNQRKKSQGKKR